MRDAYDVAAPRWYEPLVRLRFLLAGIYLIAVLLLFGFLFFPYQSKPDHASVPQIPGQPPSLAELLEAGPGRTREPEPDLEAEP